MTLMIIRCAQWAREFRSNPAAADLDRADLHVLAVLALFADRDGTARPSLRQLVASTGYDPGSIRHSRARLQRAGAIRIERGANRRVTRYLFPFSPYVELSPSASGDATSRGQVASGDATGASGDATGASGDARIGDTVGDTLGPVVTIANGFALDVDERDRILNMVRAREWDALDG